MARYDRSAWGAATAATRMAPCSERLERLRSVWLGLAACCSDVPSFPLGGGKDDL